MRYSASLTKRRFLSYFTLFLTLSLFAQPIGAANPTAPFAPSDNVMDPGDTGTTWGGCTHADPNCYVTNGGIISSAAAVPTGNILQISNLGDAVRYLTASSTSTQVLGGASFIVGSTNTLVVNSSGNLTKINGVSYLWPTVQGAGSTSTVLQNDGAGNLIWSVSSGLVNLNQAYNNSTSTSEFTLNGSQGALTVRDTLGGIGKNLFEIQDNGNTLKYLTVSSTSTYLASNVGIGVAVPRAALDVNGTILEKGPAANVKAFGAIGDGVTDDTTAIQAALTASKNVYFPSGTYVTSNVTVTNDGTRIFGDGTSSIIQMKTGSTGVMIDAGSNKITAEDLAMFGGLTSTQKVVSSSPANRTGLSLNANLDSKLHHLSIYGFGNAGLKLASAAADRLTHLVFTDSSAYNNWMGVDASVSSAEYIRFSNLDINANYYGLKLLAGNFTMSNSKVTDNGFGIYVYGTGNNNNGHGNINGSLINHNTEPIHALDVTIGFNFVANNIFEGNIYLKNSTGINIEDGILDVANYYFEGGGINYIRNNYSPNGYANVVNHNFNSTTDQTLMIDNYLSNGTFIDTNHNIVSDGNILYTAGKLTIGSSVVTYSSNIIPAMTSDTAPSGFVTESSQFNSSNFAANKAFDHVEGTNLGWASDGSALPQWIGYQFTTVKTVVRYKIQAIGAGNDGPNEVPNTWLFQGSANGSSWTTLDSRSSEASWSGNQERTYDVASPGAYAYYRLYVTATNSSVYVGINELKMLESSASTYRIGIGQASPISTLDVNGGITVGSTYSGTNAAPASGMIVQGSVGIGTSAPTGKFTVADAASTVGNLIQVSNSIDSLRYLTVSSTATVISNKTFVDLSGTQATFAVCHPSNGQTTAQELVDCSPTVGADYKEFYPTEPGVEVGDIVAPGTSFATTIEGDAIPKLIKTSSAYQSAIVGVITDPATANDFNSVGHNISDQDRPMPMALNGRVKVRVTSENGSIRIGDPITSSSTPGTGMKATASGRIVGVALERLDGTTGTIMIFVNPTWFAGTSGNVFAAVGQAHAVGISADTLEQLAISGALTVMGHMDVGPDTAGEAVVRHGSIEVRISFAESYSHPPVITVTPTGESALNGDFRWAIVDKTANGFTIRLSSPPSADTAFDWHAVGSANGRRFFSDGTSESLTDEAPPAPAPDVHEELTAPSDDSEDPHVDEDVTPTPAPEEAETTPPATTPSEGDATAVE